GQYCTAFIRSPEPLLMASNPVPANKATGVVDLVFQWTPGMTAVTHDVYVGTNPDITEADYKTTMPAAMYYHFEGFEPGVTYYWRIDEVDAAGAKFTGKVWSFTAMANTASAPSPADGATGVGVTPT